LIAKIIILASVENPAVFYYRLRALRLLDLLQKLKVVDTVYKTNPNNQVQKNIARIFDYILYNKLRELRKIFQDNPERFRLFFADVARKYIYSKQHSNILIIRLLIKYRGNTKEDV
jgi:hypothetical protein